MANPVHLSILKSGTENWNNWRRENGCTPRPDFRGADLRKRDLRWADLRGADFGEAVLREANFRQACLRNAVLYYATVREADLRLANLSRAHLYRANLYKAYLSNANLSHTDLRNAFLRKTNLNATDLSGANLNEADLGEANLSKANLTAASLERATLIHTRCDKTIFAGCRVYGLSAWDLHLAYTQQTNLVITPSGEADITVDNLELAQFIYLLLNNARIREVIDTITSKVVLILGRFTPERKVVLDAIRESLRTKNYSPVVFDFEKPTTRDLTETVMTLAGMAKFVIADLTDPKSIPHELMSFVEKLPSVPVQPLLLASQKQEYAMFPHLQRYPWVMATVLYQDQESLLHSLESTVILPAEQKAEELIATQRK